MDRIGPLFAVTCGHVSTHRPRADTPRTASVGRHPDSGRTRRPARRRGAHRAAVCEPTHRPGRARGVGTRPVRRVPTRPRVPLASAHAQRRRGAGRTARPDRRPPCRAADDGAHGERDGNGQDPAGAAQAPRPPARHTPGVARLHGPARRVRRPGRGGPAHPRRRGTPPPTGLPQIHRPQRPAQRTHPACLRDRRPRGPVVRHGHRRRHRRGPHLPARSPHRRQNPARLVRGARGSRPGPARAVRLRHGGVPARGHLADPRDGGADPRPPSRRCREPGGVRADGRPGPTPERWLRVRLRAERLDWLPPALASIDRPFVIERPAELRDLVVALADRLTSCARRASGPDGWEPQS